ncbi:TPA: hypothetical protein ACGR4L_004312 [Serratia marcescens]|uniref:hypothetical protein n=1 Tax=Serratia marcescens TaxID=615 RepID=UPI001115212A|nr:hypothetical protein [Serratia marcescens]
MVTAARGNQNRRHGDLTAYSRRSRAAPDRQKTRKQENKDKKTRERQNIKKNTKQHERNKCTIAGVAIKIKADLFLSRSRVYFCRHATTPRAINISPTNTAAPR